MGGCLGHCYSEGCGVLLGKPWVPDSTVCAHQADMFSLVSHCAPLHMCSQLLYHLNDYKHFHPHFLGIIHPEAGYFNLLLVFLRTLFFF